MRIFGWIGFSLATIASVIVPQNADAVQFKVLHAFSGGKDGSSPLSVPLIGKHGHLYDLTTNYGSGRNLGKRCSKGCGDAVSTSLGGKETTLVFFHEKEGNLFGAGPGDSLISDSSGNLYGTAETGGAYSEGTVYKITPNKRVNVLYSFCPGAGLCTDGANPLAGVTIDPEGNLYGTTGVGGNGNPPRGTVYELSAQGEETVLHSFCSSASCTDGENPYAGVFRDKDGNLYGTTHNGGENAGGVVYKVTSEGEETVLYSFCSQPNCVDGEYPYGGLIMDKSGNLYGTTVSGGANNEGTVFRLNSQGIEDVLYSFCSAISCTDGAGPVDTLLLDNSGNLFGTTGYGGYTNCEGVGCGTVFELTPDGTEMVLHAFCSTGNCTDGWQPLAGLSMNNAGNLFGTTINGGHVDHCDCGVVFELTP